MYGALRKTLISVCKLVVSPDCSRCKLFFFLKTEKIWLKSLQSPGVSWFFKNLITSIFFFSVRIANFSTIDQGYWGKSPILAQYSTIRSHQKPRIQMASILLPNHETVIFHSWKVSEKDFQVFNHRLINAANVSSSKSPIITLWGCVPFCGEGCMGGVYEFHFLSRKKNRRGERFSISILSPFKRSFGGGQGSLV